MLACARPHPLSLVLLSKGYPMRTIKQGKAKREYRPHYDADGKLIRRYRRASTALVPPVTYPAPIAREQADYRPSADYRAHWTNASFADCQALDVIGTVRSARALRKLLAKREKPIARISESVTAREVMLARALAHAKRYRALCAPAFDARKLYSTRRI